MDKFLSSAIREHLRAMQRELDRLLTMLDADTNGELVRAERRADETQCDFVHRMLLTQTEPLTVRGLAALTGIAPEQVRGVLYGHRDLFLCTKVSPRRCVWSARKFEVPA